MRSGSVSRGYFFMVITAAVWLKRFPFSLRFCFAVRFCVPEGVPHRSHITDQSVNSKAQMTCLCFESNTTNNTTVGMLFCYEFPVFHVTSVMTRCVNY